MDKLTPIHIIHGKKIEEITGAKTTEKQIENLVKNKIFYTLDASDKPRVTVINGILPTVNQKPEKPNRSIEPNMPNVHRIN